MALPARIVAHGDTIEVDQEYFQTLFMRAHLCPPYLPDDSALVRIQRSEYDFLTRSLGDYFTLRKNLLDSGVKMATLSMFTQPHFGTPAPDSQQLKVSDSQQPKVYDPPATAAVCEVATVPQASKTASRPTEPSRFVPSAKNHVTLGDPASVNAPHNQQSRQFKLPDNTCPVRSPSDEPPVSPRQDVPAPTNLILSRDQRTLELSSLSPETTLKDVAEHIRGGVIIEIYTFNNRTVRVSFLRGSDAQAFRTHAKRNDIYINSKRIEVDWAGRQLHLNAYLLNKVTNNGATRILRLRNASRVVNEEMIRDDMEHIHNLVILDVKLQANDVIVYTNSIQLLGYARTCMMSRMPYKQLKMDYLEDDCAAPLPEPVRPNFFNVVQPTPRRQLKLQKCTNLFSVLNSESTEDCGDGDNLDRLARHDSGLSDFSSDICRPRSVDTDAVSYA